MTFAHEASAVEVIRRRGLVTPQGIMLTCEGSRRSGFFQVRQPRKNPQQSRGIGHHDPRSQGRSHSHSHSHHDQVGSAFNYGGGGAYSDAGSDAMSQYSSGDWGVRADLSPSANPLDMVGMTMGGNMRMGPDHAMGLSAPGMYLGMDSEMRRGHGLDVGMGMPMSLHRDFGDGKGAGNYSGLGNNNFSSLTVETPDQPAHASAESMRFERQFFSTPTVSSSSVESVPETSG